jgi:nucleoside-diphosphate-sugar epimerase
MMDSTKMMALGWRPEISLQAGIASTYQWFLEHKVAVA